MLPKSLLDKEWEVQNANRRNVVLIFVRGEKRCVLILTRAAR